MKKEFRIILISICFILLMIILFDFLFHRPLFEIQEIPIEIDLGLIKYWRIDRKIQINIISIIDLLLIIALTILIEKNLPSSEKNGKTEIY